MERPLEVGEVVGRGARRRAGHGEGGVVVGAAFGFADDFVDAAQHFDVGGGVAEGGGGLLLLAGVLPHDGGAAFGRDDGVDGVLEHEDAVGDGEGQRAAGAAFAGDGGDGGDAEAGHFEQVAGDGFALAALFGTEAGVGAGADR